MPQTLPVTIADVSAVSLVETIIEAAFIRGASDIHIEPYEDSVVVRYRVDGLMVDAGVFSKYAHEEVIARIKVLAGLRTDVHVRPQDGRFKCGEDSDVRVSIMPVQHGENAVLRILKHRNEIPTLQSAGFTQIDAELLQRTISKTSGMVLCTGPTGSGKTTTLYTLIESLSKTTSSIVTIEDPIEYSIERVQQVQVTVRSDFGFAEGLRNILRQDPDIIMVGEVRDRETAAIAIHAALTGHLLLTTLHTTNAATAFPRLCDMGIDPYLLASTVSVVVAQRLVRKICEKCKETVRSGGTVPEVLYRGRGCEACAGSGYRGRAMIYELLVVDDDIRDATLQRCPAKDIDEIARINGMVSIVERGAQCIEDGTTTFEEVTRVLQ
jgi:general secretion pathway protein E